MIVILNFGSQFAHLIARRVRDLGVHSEILPHDIGLDKIRELNPDGIILSGGPSSVNERGAPRPLKSIYSLGVPVLGICYGQQLMAKQLGGKVEKGDKHEYGKEELELDNKSKLFKGCSKTETVWFSHGDSVTKLPLGFKKNASTKSCIYAGIEDSKNNFYSLQFHPEVTHTVHGKKIISNFVFDICKSEKNWRISSLRDTILSRISEEVPEDEHVLIACSGGVDSLVVATLMKRALGDRAHAVMIDTGLLRKNEAKEVLKNLKNAGMDWLKVHDSSKIFLKKLKNVSDPEKKRKIIGHTFIEEFEKYVKKNLKKYPITYLAQGTIYPDRIESAEPSKNASKIKSHHNLTLPEKMSLKVIEPIRDLYKDEVRKLGKSLSLPRDVLWRHPFPGPGLAIRILGEVTEDRVKVLQEVDAIYIEELRKNNYYDKTWMAFSALFNDRAVGVLGDSRVYGNIVALRAVNSVDTMTADWTKIPNPILEKISSRIMNEVRGVTRVLYDITQKPPGTMEYE